MRTPESVEQLVGRTAGPSQSFRQAQDRVAGGRGLSGGLPYSHWPLPLENVRTNPTWKTDLLAFHFEHGTLLMTEVGARKRASVHIVHNKVELAAFDLRCLEPLEYAEVDFR